MQFLDKNQKHIRRPKVSIICAPYGGSVTWGKGAENGPRAILEASQALEVFDDELLIETWRHGIETIPQLALAGLSSSEACRVICVAVAKELNRGRLPVVLGGEHTVSLPAVGACLRHFPNLNVVQIDAHLDLRDSYLDNPLNHACVMRRIDDLAVPVCQIGIRSFSREEWEFVQKKPAKIFTMQRIRDEKKWCQNVVRQLDGPVYLSIDLDGFDPAVIPATGTPEPDGLSWEQVTGLLRAIAEKKQIVGLDIVELAPVPGSHHAEFTAAKILYRTLGYILGQKIEG